MGLHREQLILLWTITIENFPIIAGETTAASYPNFAGHLNQVLVNGLPILDMDRDQLLLGAERTAEYLPTAAAVAGVDTNGKAIDSGGEHTTTSFASVLSFPSRAAFLGLPQMRAYLDLSLRLAFRTAEATGLLLYNAGRRSDFLAVELAEGHVHLVASLGGRTVELKDNYPAAVNDNQWHVLVVARTGTSGQRPRTTSSSRMHLACLPWMVSQDFWNTQGRIDKQPPSASKNTFKDYRKFFIIKNFCLL